MKKKPRGKPSAYSVSLLLFCFIVPLTVLLCLLPAPWKESVVVVCVQGMKAMQGASSVLVLDFATSLRKGYKISTVRVDKNANAKNICINQCQPKTSLWFVSKLHNNEYMIWSTILMHQCSMPVAIFHVFKNHT